MKPSLIKSAALTLLLASVASMTGCATQAKYDYTAFKQAKPASILVLPPLNESTDVNASFSMLAQTTFPLAESGYYVLPVTLVAETFRNNGLSVPAEMHGVSTQKLKKVFGADAALYIKIKQYGSSYTIFNSAAVVSAEARLLALPNGQLLWEGKASATNDSGNNNGGGLTGMLVSAIVKQIINETTDASHPVAGMAARQMLTAGGHGRMLYGPRSPMYGQNIDK